MDWAGRQHPVETLVEWVAPLPLAAAAFWAGRLFGFSMVEAAAAAVTLLTAGFAVMKVAGGGPRWRLPQFQPATLDSPQPGLDELILQPSDVLLELNDPLPMVEEDARVVRLFERQEPTPGELVTRISDFLGEAQRFPAAAADPPMPCPPDASDALHAALANIRASLR
ncbi:MAG: hypothetical protein LOX97_08815 [Sphingomonas sp.]|nr:hypothetical protein [Sphingomonas sp.]